MTFPLTLAHSPSPDDTFVFHAWTAGLLPGVAAPEVTIADIDVTNVLAANDTHDVLRVSYAALPYLLDRYAMLPCGGALGHGCGPLLLTREAYDPEELPGRTVAIPAARSTAYLLFRQWVAERLPGRRVRTVVLPFDQIMPAVRDGLVDAGLVIHEARFTYHKYGLHRLLDLGEDWEARTALPIPLGAVVARRSLGPEVIAEVTDVIRASVRHAWADPLASFDYVSAHAEEMAFDVQRRHINTYVNEYTTDLGPDGYRAVRVLLETAAAAGVVPSVPSGALDQAVAVA
jgi:1,4-dihydroxy-6-naphthoate synthase